jgi:hypothetical protein
MTARFLTNIILTICILCAAGILLLAFFVADDWYAAKQPVMAIIHTKQVDTIEKKVFSRYQPASLQKNDSALPGHNNRYYFTLLITNDTLLMPVTSIFYHTKQGGDTIVLIKSVGRFSKRVFYRMGDSGGGYGNGYR